jgi:hypothetical protein
MSNDEQPKRKPFLSWIEVITILTIIGMVAAFLLPAQHSTRPHGAHRASLFAETLPPQQE